MSSMDKRKGGLIGPPKHRVNVHVVKREDKDGGNVAIEQVFSTVQKADDYILQQSMTNKPYDYTYEKWSVL